MIDIPVNDNEKNCLKPEVRENGDTESENSDISASPELRKKKDQFKHYFHADEGNLIDVV